MSMSKNVAHTSARGVEPYDKCFGVGVHKKLESGGFSPYPRIERIREMYKTSPLFLDSGRALAFTAAYKEYEAQPIVIKKARALERYMKTCPLNYVEGELLLLDDGSKNFAAPVYLENGTWIYDELRDRPLDKRSYNPFVYDDKTRDEILSTEEYWKGKSIKDAFLARLPEDTAKGCASAGRMNIFNPSIMVDMGVGHITPNYEYGLQKGLGGIKTHVRQCREKLGTPTDIAGVRSLEFYDAELIVLDAISALFRRYAAFAKEQADVYSSQQTKDELLHMSEMCRHLAEKPPRDFWEAVEFTYMIHVVAFMECNGQAIALGRTDQYLYPFYQKSLEDGTYTKDFMQELLEFFYLKLTTHEKLAPDTGNDQWRGGVRGWTSSALIVGGTDKDGNDVTNDLTFMLLDAMIHTRLVNPFITVRWHDGTPYELKVKVAEMVRLGMGHPKMMNDPVCEKALMRHGVSHEDAMDYVNIGCVELEAPGKTFGWHDNSYITLPKVLELALNNGRCFECSGERCRNYGTCCRGVGKSIGLETGYLKDFKTFEEVRSAYEAQLKYWADRTVQAVDLLQACHIERDDYPFMSTLILDCTDSGKSLMQGGARYNFTGIQCLGPATTADSLTALKQVVYEEKKCTPEEFYDALLKNWEGHQRLYQLVNSDKVHHYGNDDDYADAMMKYVLDSFCNRLQSYPPTRGGIGVIKDGVLSTIINLLSGLVCGASPDGRKHHEAISENIGAARTAHSNRDRNGPTAYARSIGKLNHEEFGSGTLINMRFGSDTISGEKGRDNFIDFLDGYFKQGPMHIQFMVADRDTLIDAQKHPEEYQDLLVRVSGFSSYFHTLSKGFQDELINRTEQSFD